jgi:hypothetical protein
VTVQWDVIFAVGNLSISRRLLLATIITKWLSTIKSAAPHKNPSHPKPGTKIDWQLNLICASRAPVFVPRHGTKHTPFQHSLRPESVNEMRDLRKVAVLKSFINWRFGQFSWSIMYINHLRQQVSRIQTNCIIRKLQKQVKKLTVFEFLPLSKKYCFLSVTTKHASYHKFA